MLKPVVLSIVALVSVLLAGGSMAPAGAKPPPPQAARMLPTKPYVTFMGHDSRITDIRFLRITDHESWVALWRDHRGAEMPKNASGWPNVPQVDFERCQVIAIFRGEGWNCNGEYLVSMTDRGAGWRLRVDSSTFQTFGPDGGGVRVTSYGMFVIPRGMGSITLESNVQALKGLPPEWKVEHRFDPISD